VDIPGQIMPHPGQLITDSDLPRAVTVILPQGVAARW
jgi:hypothetical protein